MEALEQMSEPDWWKAHAWTDQRTPALAVVARGDQIRETAPCRYTVCSQSAPGTFHHVAKNGSRWSCDCPFFAATRMSCIHILSVRYRNGLRDSAPSATPSAVVCESCRSTQVVSDGVRHNKSGDVQTYLCRTCGKRFADRRGFHNRRSDPEKIAISLDLYFRGLSLHKVAEHLRQVYDLKISHVTIYRWVVHYGKLAAQWMDAQGARTGDRWHIDETVVNVNGEHTYLWNVLDGESRFLLATHISHNRDMDNTRAPIRKAKAVTPDRPVDVLTDGMNSYPVAVGKELGRRATPFDDPKVRSRRLVQPAPPCSEYPGEGVQQQDRAVPRNRERAVQGDARVRWRAGSGESLRRVPRPLQPRARPPNPWYDAWRGGRHPDRRRVPLEEDSRRGRGHPAKCNA
ncbi:MAG: IS1/IS6 family transposase [Thermoplasmata archaeon]|nr:IS1/IS6 family transposase [Thermoplasmata archaeon]